ncbi:MAG: type II toxin-antitoxin system RelE/ParE family toxin [Actinomycetia bacterium]|nr:type II toxin-antitoxin system RelE/ParE family toxin [Actinomycetes bacterium]
MANYRVELAEPAEDDLRDIARYISAQLSAPITALRMMEIIEKALRGLSEMPKRCPLVRDDRLAGLGYRALLVEHYVAFYSINESEKVVNVERVLYARRNWANLL